MTPTESPPAFDVEKAKAVWDEYQRTHDLSHLHGKAVGTDPLTGEVWFGDTRVDIDEQMRAAGKYPRPLYVTRVGLGYYQLMTLKRKCPPEA
jgi:hypothetical protein